MLERGRRNGAALAGMLIGMPVTQAPATVMEFDTDGTSKVTPSLNYIQRGKLKVRGALRRSGRALRRGSRAPAQTPVKNNSGAKSGAISTLPILTGPDWVETDLAAYLPGGFLPEDLSAPDGDDDDPDDVIIETARDENGLWAALPPEAVTVVASQHRVRDDEAGFDLDEMFPHLANQPLAQLAAEIAEIEGIPPALFIALVEAESSFDADAVSVKGAMGLTQLMPATAEELGVDPEDPLDNLSGGARYLAAQYRRFGSWDLALAAYNAGPTRVARVGGVPDIVETRDFVARVLDAASESARALARAF